MSPKRLDDAIKLMPPQNSSDADGLARELERRAGELTAEELSDVDTRLNDMFPNGFTHRDEANALIAMAVRNGPLESLHAGAQSELLKDDSLSRITDDEMKMLMIFATRTLVRLLRLRDTKPDVYRRYVQSFGGTYCSRWERDG